MISEYLKIFLRQFYRNPLNTIISIASLVLGITCTVLMLLFIRYELSYDKFHKNRKDIYRVVIKSVSEDREDIVSTITAAVGPSFQQEFPEVINSVRVRSAQSGYLKYNTKNIPDNQIRYVDPTFFKVFSFRLLKGNPETALLQPYSIVLEETIATKLFGNQEPLGQTVILNNQDAFIVTGIMETPPKNSHIQFSSLISFNTLYEDSRMHLGWDGGWQYLTYIQLNSGFPISELIKKMPDFMYKNINKKYEQFGTRLDPIFEPLSRVYLHSKALGGSQRGSVGVILIFSAISVFILVLASINFINLSTAQGIMRSREVGIRKVFGAQRRSLIYQFLGESILMSMIALVLALLIIGLILPHFNQLAYKDLKLFHSSNWIIIVAFPFIILLTGILSGAYPAIYLSAFQPLSIIQGKMFTGSGKQRIRNILVLFQFFISVVLIITAATLSRQLKYMTNIDLGFDKDKILIISLTSEETSNKHEMIKQELNLIPEISSLSASSNMLGTGMTSNGYLPEGFENPVMVNVVDVDFDFLETYNLKVTSGREFDRKFVSDENNYLVNETFVKEMNWVNPVGKFISRNGKHEVLGIINDFHFAPMHQPIKPLIFTMKPYIGYSYLNIRFNTNDIPGLLTKIENKWERVVPEEPFKYSFLTDILQSSYGAETRIKK